MFSYCSHLFYFFTRLTKIGTIHDSSNITIFTKIIKEDMTAATNFI